jgi:hypothetical protein
MNIIRAILGPCTSRISVFHSDLVAIQKSLQLHAIPTEGLSLTQCRRILLHHIATGAFFD